MNGFTGGAMLADIEAAHRKQVRELQERIRRMSDALAAVSERVAVAAVCIGDGTGYRQKVVAQTALADARDSLRAIGY